MDRGKISVNLTNYEKTLQPIERNMKGTNLSAKSAEIQFNDQEFDGENASIKQPKISEKAIY